ncbi:hypothetical protein EG68_07710 [Paragonimus skrjabini miyazakii]|uniref:mitogen-activated protein kinase kinase n=1 Tax=Paragonimus skrjabini miyazakii TaxID=59628 RepID=A0A8S9YSX9_9TREM|nr:hypothetical protein EG68_07710 [Paragonimus skrjabini miyazakii]
MSGRKIMRPPPLAATLSRTETPDPFPPGLSSETQIEVDGEQIVIRVMDLERLSTIGRGQFGRVNKMRHKPTGRIFAVKYITPDPESIKRKQIENELQVAKNTPCPCLVKCYGGLIHELDVLVIMELLDISLDTLRARVYGKNQTIPENLLAYIMQRVVTGLHFLRTQMSIMHRDVKPSNLLANRLGMVKVCDFGISGTLIKSMAPTNIGTSRYMGPERIDPKANATYRIESDVWSLGLSLMELSTGKLCYHGFTSMLEQMREIVNGEPLRLPTDDRYSVPLQNFVSRCLVKKPEERANYVELLESDFLRSVNVEIERENLSKFLVPYLDPNP